MSDPTDLLIDRTVNPVTEADTELAVKIIVEAQNAASRAALEYIAKVAAEPFKLHLEGPAETYIEFVFAPTSHGTIEVQRHETIVTGRFASLPLNLNVTYPSGGDLTIRMVSFIDGVARYSVRHQGGESGWNDAEIWLN